MASRPHLGNASRFCLLAGLLVANCASGTAQASAPSPLAERSRPAQTPGALPHDLRQLLAAVARVMGNYARDISEIPLTVQSTVTRFDRNGKQRSSNTATHSMQFIRRSYNGGEVTRRLHAHKPGLHRISKDELNGDEATAVLALIFDNGTPSAAYRYDLTEHVVSKRFEVNLGDSGECQAFDPMIVDHRKWCGGGHLLLDSSTLVPLTATFKAGGFPQTFDNITYLSFSFKEEFQTVPVEASAQPLLLPAIIVLNYESDKGRTVVESRFSLAPKNTASRSRSF